MTDCLGSGGTARSFVVISALSCMGCPSCNRNTQSDAAALTTPTRSATLQTQPGAPQDDVTPHGERPSEPRDSTGSASPGSEQPHCTIPLAEHPPPPAPPATACPEPGRALPVLEEGLVRFPQGNGAPEVLVELANTTQARSIGLMFRRKLEEDRGMLFTFDGEQPRSFWMKNTCLPLDMIFIDRRGYVVSILEQVPPMNLLSRPSRCPAHRVLEVSAGWSRRHGVRPGQRVEVEP
jgi:uncharacterized protein